MLILLKNKWIISLILISGLFYFGFLLFSNNKKVDLKKDINKIKQINAQIVGQIVKDEHIETIGSVKPATQIDVSALSGGTIKELFFKVGDKIQAGQLLSVLNNNGLEINLNNSQTNLNNTKNNLNATKGTTDEIIKQAEIGIRNSKELIRSSEIALKIATDNLSNAKITNKKKRQDTKKTFSYLLAPTLIVFLIRLIR